MSAKQYFSSKAKICTCNYAPESWEVYLADIFIDVIARNNRNEESFIR